MNDWKNHWNSGKFDPFKILAFVFILALAASFAWNTHISSEVVSLNQQLAVQTKTIEELETVSASSSDTFSITQSSAIKSAPVQSEKVQAQIDEKTSALSAIERELERTDLEAAPSENYERFGADIDAQNRTIQSVEYQIASYQDQLIMLDAQERNERQLRQSEWRNEDGEIANQLTQLSEFVRAKTAEANELRTRPIEIQTVQLIERTEYALAQVRQSMHQFSERRNQAQRSFLDAQFTPSGQVAQARNEAQRILEGLRVQHQAETNRLAAIQQDLFQANEADSSRQLQLTVRENDRDRLQKEVQDLRVQLEGPESNETLSE